MKTTDETKTKKLPKGIFEKAKGSEVYWILYTDRMGKRHREKCGTLTHAKGRLAIRHSEKARGVETVMTPKAVTLGTLIDDAIAHVKAENGIKSGRDLIYKFEIIRAEFGPRLVSGIKTADVVGWLKRQATERGWSQASRNRYQAAWSKIFSVAIDNEKAAVNPAAKILRKRENNQRERQLSAGEETALRDVIAQKFPSYVPVFEFALHTGMRASEQLRAVVGDYSGQQLTVHQQKVRTAASLRHVPATPVAVSAYKIMAQGKQAGAPLFSKDVVRDGNTDLKSMRYWFDQCVEAAGIENFKWHDLRHTYASRLVMAGVPLATVAMYMGHQSVQMTMRYSHLAPGSDGQAVTALMSFYGTEERATGTEGKPRRATGGARLRLVPEKA